MLSKATIGLLCSKASFIFGFILIFFECILFFRFEFNVVTYFFDKFIFEINFCDFANTELPGFKEGNQIYIKIYDVSEQVEYQTLLNIEQGSINFEETSFVVISEIDLGSVLLSTFILIGFIATAFVFIKLTIIAVNYIKVNYSKEEEKDDKFKSKNTKGF